MTDERVAVIEYVIDDGSGIPETHRQTVDMDVTVGELVEFLDGATYIPSGSLRLLNAAPWEE